MGIQLNPKKASSLTLHSIKMKVTFVLLIVLVANTLAQDTHFCPDGWELHNPEGKDECKCFLFADAYVKVTHADATTLCNARGGWLAEPDDGPEDNYFIVNQLLARRSEKAEKFGEELEGPHYEDEWWIGAKSYTKHSDHAPGDWIWETLNTTVEWFDWAPDQPNDYHRQQCMSYVRWNYFGEDTYQWNDLDCETNVADYICQKSCSMIATMV